jgi:hypothetical protein
MNDRDEIIRLLNRVEALERFLRDYDPGGGSDAQPVVVTTKTIATYPTTAGSFFAATLATLTGQEAEGNIASVGSLAGDLFVMNVGATVPPNAANLIAIPIGKFLVVEFDS